MKVIGCLRKASKLICILPDLSWLVLNFGCDFCCCIKIFYLLRSIEFNISATSAPTTRITPAGIFTYENRKMVVNAILDDGRREAILSLTYVSFLLQMEYIIRFCELSDRN